MAAHIPAKLKAADLTRFCVRAAQLETAKPVVAYWCEYWIANQILTRGLHNGDNETLEYATTLMDKLEQIKADNATNDAIVDDMAGQAYVEHFASETFDRASRAVDASKVTKQTADTFQAAATFFELVNIWGPPDEETQAKIKYAKWNAVRIAKALKEGKDPNESNPKPQIAEETQPPSDSNLSQDQIGVADGSRNATVEEVPDEEEQYKAPQPSIGQPLSPTTQASSLHTTKQDASASPLESSQANNRHGSVGGGYFPPPPTFTAEASDPTFPTAPPDDVNDLGLPDQPSFTPGSRTLPIFAPPPQSPPEVEEYFRTPPPPSHPDIPHVPLRYPAPQQARDLQNQTAPPFAPPPAPIPAPAQPPPVQSRAVGTNLVEVDDIAMAQAQKHARWAISALNFEDTPTAIKELREALRTLGADA